MAWYEKLLKKVGKGEPVPQYFNDTTNDYEVIKGEEGATFVKVKNFPGQQDVQIKGSDNALEVKGEALNDIATGSLTVISTAVELKVGAFALVNRKQIILHPPSAGTIYWGKSDVTSATGSPLSSGQQPIYFDVDAGSPALFAVSDGTNRTVRVVEIS